MSPHTADITGLLHRWRAGDRTAEEELFTAVLPDLRRMAQKYISRERPGHTLQATELVDQMYFKLVAAKDRDWQNRGHFYAIAARAMRRYLIDHARGRPNAQFVELEGLEYLLPTDVKKTEMALSVDKVLSELGDEHPDWVHLVEMRYFLGLTNEEAADALGVSPRTLHRVWSDARQWLFEHMQDVGPTRDGRPESSHE